MSESQERDELDNSVGQKDLDMSCPENVSPIEFDTPLSDKVALDFSTTTSQDLSAEMRALNETRDSLGEEDYSSTGASEEAAKRDSSPPSVGETSVPQWQDMMALIVKLSENFDKKFVGLDSKLTSLETSNSTNMSSLRIDMSTKIDTNSANFDKKFAGLEDNNNRNMINMSTKIDTNSANFDKKIAGLEAKLDSNSTNMSSLRADMSTEIKAIDTNMTTKIESLRSDNANMSTSIEKLVCNNLEISAKFASLEKNNVNIHTKIESLRADMTGNSVDISEKFASLESNDINMLANMVSNNVAIVGVTAKVEGFEARLESIGEVIKADIDLKLEDNYEKQFNYFKGRDEEIKLSLTKFESKLGVLDLKIEQLQLDSGETKALVNTWQTEREVSEQNVVAELVNLTTKMDANKVELLSVIETEKSVMAQELKTFKETYQEKLTKLERVAKTVCMHRSEPKEVTSLKDGVPEDQTKDGKNKVNGELLFSFKPGITDMESNIDSLKSSCDNSPPIFSNFPPIFSNKTSKGVFSSFIKNDSKPIFDGTGLNIFLKNLETLLNILHPEENELVENFQIFLKGKARQWWEITKRPGENWSSIRQRLVTYWCDREKVKEDWKRLNFKPHFDIERFVLRGFQLQNELKGEGNLGKKIEKVTAKLPSPLREFMLMKASQTIEQFLQNIKELIKYQHDMPLAKPQQSFSIQAYRYNTVKYNNQKDSGYQNEPYRDLQGREDYRTKYRSSPNVSFSPYFRSKETSKAKKDDSPGYNWDQDGNAYAPSGVCVWVNKASHPQKGTQYVNAIMSQTPPTEEQEQGLNT